MQTLQLRPEFQSEFGAATAIELRNKQNSGWAQTTDPNPLLEITYPTADVQRALEAVSAAAAGRPIVFIGQRGRGKSHIMAVLHHAFECPDPVETWTNGWAGRLQSSRLKDLKLQRGFLAISETMSNSECVHLWDVLFERHPKGAYFKGRFEQAGTTIPSKSLLQDLFAEQKTALILDEFQTWFDGLHDEPGDEGRKRRQWAFNFIQLLSELAKDRPDLLCLVVSVRDSTTEGYRQIHRVGPMLIDFKGETARDDRRRLVLHRLFQNRDNFTDAEIDRIVDVYATEKNRLLHSDHTDADKSRLRTQVVESWPFAPELIGLLEGNMLMTDTAQDNRDMIRILADVYRERGDQVPLLTPADFSVDNDSCGVLALIDCFTTNADQEKLREKALHNLEKIREANINAPHACEVISSLWVRSVSATEEVGGTRQEVQLDITRAQAIDDNGFTLELDEIIDNSFNIHEVGTAEKRFCFRLPENPVSKVKAWARNDKSFEPETAAPPGLLAVRRDQEYLRTFLDHLFKSPESATQQPSRPIVLDPNWEKAPWANVQQADQPSKWHERGDPVLIVLPVAPADNSATLGPWLAEHVPVNRNMVRFLLPKKDMPNIYDDPNLKIMARCAMLAQEWGQGESQYDTLYKRRFRPELRKELVVRFNRYVVLTIWDFQEPTKCEFEPLEHGASGSEIPTAVEKHLFDNFFDPTDFETFIVDAAQRGDSMEQVLALLREGPLPGQQAIPYRGEADIYDEVLALAAKDKIVLNVGGSWCGREANQTEAQALARLKQRAYKTGRDMYLVQLALPDQIGSGGVTATPPVGPPATPTVPPPGPTPPGPTPPTTPGTGVTPDPGLPGQPPVPDTTPPSTPSTPVIRQSMGAKTGINLLGDLEDWGFPDAKQVTEAQLTINGLSVKDLRDLCTKLPPKIRAELQITLPPEGDPT